MWCLSFFAMLLPNRAQVSLDHLASYLLLMVAGSVCKDWSSMGKGAGFTGQWVVLCALLIALCARLQPVLLVHECTLRFPHQVFDQLLGKTHRDYHADMSPLQFGVPVRRGRAYDAVAT